MPLAGTPGLRYVKDMPKSWNEEKLKEVFGACGAITSTMWSTDKKERAFASRAFCVCQCVF